MINHDNIEDYIIDFVSEELTESEIVELNDFLNSHPQYRELIDEYQTTILTEDVIYDNISPQIDSLKREDEPKTTVLNKSWTLYSLGIAAVIGGAAILFSNFYDFKPEENLSSDIKKQNSVVAKTPPAALKTTKITREENKNQNNRNDNSTEQVGLSKNPISKSNKEPILTPELVINSTPITRTIHTIEPVYFTPRLKQQSLVVHTQLINPEDLPKFANTSPQNEIEFTIAGKAVDLNLESLQEIKNKIDDVKQTINDRVEEVSAEPISLWDIIKK